MKGSEDIQFKLELKELIIQSCQLPLSPQEFEEDKPLFGKNSSLGMDSIDALQMSMAIQKKYGILISDSKELRRAAGSLNAFADYLRPE